MEVLEKEIQLEIDKSTWTLVKLGDLADEISVRVDNPATSKYDRFVGLEHFVSGDLKIKNWGTTKNLTSSTKAFKKGDILFARRNAYLRRASLVDFDGVCSGDAFVIRENYDKVVPGFLSFLMNSNALWDYANSNAAGTMSKRVKWRDLADYEFLLPPQDQQKLISEFLWAGDEMIQKGYKINQKLSLFYDITRNNFIKEGVANWPVKKLKEIAIIVGGFAFNSERFQQYGKYQVLRISNISKEDFELNKNPVYVDKIEKKEEKYIIPKGAIVVSLTGTNGKRDYGYTNLKINSDITLLNQRLAMIICDSSFILPEFLFILTKMELFQNQFFLNATGTANQANVSTNDLMNIKLQVPSIDKQRYIITYLNRISAALNDANKSVVLAIQMQKSIINKIF